MSLKESEITSTSEKIQAVCKRLWDRNMLASADGNVSVRLDDDCILITPSGVSKAFMSPSEICIITLDGKVIKGKPSSERSMHLQVYRRCPQAKAVVHAHPPHAIAWSIAKPELTELPAECMSELILAAGRIPFAPYARPGTEAMGEVLNEFLPQSRLMILSRHGGLAWGESLEEAANGMERLEHSAEILFLAEKLGGLSSLPQEEVQALRDMRLKLGEKLL